MKMINIHERKLSGLPVVIQGETGVGKTYLLETLSKLWDASSRSSLSKIKADITETFCQFLRNFLAKSKDQSEVAKVNEILSALYDPKKETLTLELLEFALNMNKKAEMGWMKGSTTHKGIDMHKVLMTHCRNPVFFNINTPKRIHAYGKTVACLFDDVLDSTEVIPIIACFSVAILFVSGFTFRLERWPGCCMLFFMDTYRYCFTK